MPSPKLTQAVWPSRVVVHLLVAGSQSIAVPSCEPVASRPHLGLNTNETTLAAFKSRNALACGQVPEPHCITRGARRKRLTLRVKRHGLDGASMSLECCRALTCGQVPESCRLVERLTEVTGLLQGETAHDKTHVLPHKKSDYELRQT